MGQVSRLMGPERRRRWSDDERLQILQEAFWPGACVTHVSRRHDVSRALIYTWRRRFCQPATEPGFAEALVTDEDGCLLAALMRGDELSA